MRSVSQTKCLVLSFIFIQFSVIRGFSAPQKKNDPLFSRRSLFTWPIGIGGAVVYGNLIKEAFSKLSRGDSVYPEPHERRTASIFSLALVEGIPQDSTSRPMRVLEVGIGSDWRVQRRDLYHSGFDRLSSRGVPDLDLTGVDIVAPSPSIVQDARSRMQKSLSESKIKVNLNAIEGSITSRLNFPDGWFDCILCSLALCSVDDQTLALQEIKRLLRPNGGTFGYVEHVAVNADEPYRLLELQQKALDPLQQLVAHNCHLHRSTESTIASVFGVNSASVQLSQERFLVDEMWPVSCQTCGVIRRKS
jgi:SAM-dependent methyltransferase